MTVNVIAGDCLDVLPTLEACSVDAIVTDPPYGLGFMGKAWDHGVPGVPFWVEALRVLKPGGHMLAFGGSRTYHRMVCAIEDAGFEIRDQIMWLYGSGFPKSRNLEGEHKGWGTALKPAHEPIVVARKPLIGTVAANVLAHGCGALNIDGCRIQTADDLNGGAYRGEGSSRNDGWGMQRIGGAGEFVKPLGRWPANVIHDGSDEVVALFPAEAGAAAPIKGTEPSLPAKGDVTYGFRARVPSIHHGDSGSAARFFYCAKASREDRNEGCDGLPERAGGMVSNTSGQHITRRDGGAPGPRANHHPTVKPTALMRYLCRLVTPPGGTVLDMFAGSGSTGKACVLEGFNAVLIEADQQYTEIIHARITRAREQHHIATAQPPLFADVTA